MSGHTKGPLSIDPRADNHIVAGERPICSLSFHDTALPDGGAAENRANARRLILSWNACASLSDAALSQDVIAVVREALESWLGFAEEELSEFDIEACENKDRLCPKCESSGCINWKIRDTRAALALLATDKDDKS